MSFIKNYYVNSSAKTDIHLITHDVKRAIREAGVQNGFALVLVTGGTAGLTLLEEDPQIHQGLKNYLETQFPESEGKRPSRRSGSGKLSAHLRAALIGAQLSLPIENSTLKIGHWQEVVLFDFDDKIPRREFTIQIFSEAAPTAPEE